MTRLIIRVGGDDVSFETGLSREQFEAAVERVRPDMLETNPYMPEDTFRAIIAKSAEFLVPDTQLVMERDAVERVERLLADLQIDHIEDWR